MSLVDHTQNIEVPYSVSDTFDALQKALGKLKTFKIARVDENTKTVYAKAGVSLRSWGENITITIGMTPNGTSEVSVSSTPKTGAALGGVTDYGKNQQNIREISASLSEELKNYSPVTLTNTQPQPAQTFSAADEIKKLAELKDAGILTEEEFNSKKAELLARV